MTRVIVAAVIIRSGKLLLWRNRRRIDESLKWVLPGGDKQGAHETDASCLRRELLLRCGIKVNPEDVKLEKIVVGVGLPGCPESEFRYCVVSSHLGEPVSHEGCECAWVDLAGLRSGTYTFTEADAQFMHYLLLNEWLPEMAA